MGVDGATPPGLWERVRKIAAEEVAKFAKSGFLRNARISGGSGLTISGGGGVTVEDGGDLVVRYPSGTAAILAGDIFGQTTGDYLGTGLLVQAENGTDMMTVRTDAATGRTMNNVYDTQGNIIVGNDAASGQGLARPYLPGTFHRMRSADWPTVTNAAFEGVHKAFYYKQHPRLQTYVQVAADAATTGEVRIVVDGTQVGATQTINAGGVAILLFGPDPVAGAHMKVLVVELQARRTSGTGLVRVEPLHMYGWQS